MFVYEEGSECLFLGGLQSSMIFSDSRQPLFVTTQLGPGQRINPQVKSAFNFAVS